MIGIGNRCTHCARREKTPCSGACSVPRRSSRRAPSTHRAGTSVRATSTAITTTETPAAPMPFISGDWKTSRPPSEMATVRPEKTTVRPAESTVRATASTTIVRGIWATGMPGRAGPQLLPEPAHDEQPVVDAQPEPEDRHDVDRGGVEVDEVGEAQQRRQRPGDGGDGSGDRHAGSDEATEHDDHHEEADRQGDALAGAQVDLELPGDRVDEVAHAAGGHRRARAGGRRPDGRGDLVLERVVGLLVGQVVDRHDGDVATRSGRAALRASSRRRGSVSPPGTT